jgi:hypothetical protein
MTYGPRLGEALQIVQTDAGYDLLVDNEVVTEVAAADAAGLVAGSYQICAVQDGVGGLVALGELAPVNTECQSTLNPDDLNCNRVRCCPSGTGCSFCR